MGESTEKGAPAQMEADRSQHTPKGGGSKLAKMRIVDLCLLILPQLLDWGVFIFTFLLFGTFALVIYWELYVGSVTRNDPF